MVSSLASGLGRLDGGPLRERGKPSRQPWPTNAPVLMRKAQIQIAERACHCDLANGHPVSRKAIGLCLQSLKTRTDGLGLAGDLVLMLIALSAATFEHLA